MKNSIKLLLASVLCLFITQVSAQHLVMNNGALIHVQAGALLHVQGGITSRDAGADQGIITNFGQINLVNGAAGATFTNTGAASALPYRGSFYNTFNVTQADLNLNDGSYLFVQGDWDNDGIVTATNASHVAFNGVDQQFFRRYTNANAADGFGRVFINNSATAAAGGKVSLVNGTATSNFVVRDTLNFMNGIIETAFPLVTGNLVDVTNNTTGIITGYNTVPAITFEPDKYVLGFLRRAVSGATTYDFPVGGAYVDASTASTGEGLQNARIAFNAAVPVTTLTASFYQAPPAPIVESLCGATFNTVLNNGYWDINDPTAVVGATGYTTTLHNRDYTNAAANYAGLDEVLVWKKQGASPWTVIGVGNCDVNMFAYDVTRTGMSNFSLFGTDISPVLPFPVEMLPLTATSLTRSIRLNWQTASERNNKGFDIERSLDGTQFNKIAWVDGKGNSSQMQHYTLNDVNVSPNTLYYYRARQVDFDGGARFSNIVEGMIGGKSGFSATLYPNPTQGDLDLKINVEQDAKVSLKVYDAIGKLIINSDYSLKAGTHTISLEKVRTLAAGAYNAVITSGSEVITQKLTVIK